jgi:hypothetical protein
VKRAVLGGYLQCNTVALIRSVYIYIYINAGLEKKTQEAMKEEPLDSATIEDD